MGKIKILVVIFVISIITISCASKTRNALPKEYSGRSEIKGMPQVRDWGEERSDYYQKDLENSIKQYVQSLPEGKDLGDVTFNVLAISGGGSNGAFGAGLINGWAASGTKPTFNLVTGISTGALIAPFAFLGGKYDKEIARLYTSVDTDDIFEEKSFFGILSSILGSSDSITSTQPLQDLLNEYIDQDFLVDIAKAHSGGRRLFIGTTNLDAKRLVIWNMGAIADSGHPDALELFKSVLLASSAMPIAFPAVYINVEADGQIYDEMHVDGGVITGVFFYGNVVSLDEALINLNIDAEPQARIFIIRNSSIDIDDYEEMEIDLFTIAATSVSTLIASQGLGDLYRIYAKVQKNNIDFNLASIPADFESNPNEMFDPVEMKRLYDLGFNMALNGYPWEKYPPFLSD